MELSTYERDKFLTETMGECWHESIGSPGGGYCWKCQESHSKMEPLPNIDFSTWEGFGLLWNWTFVQPWFEDFRHTDLMITHLQKDFSYVNPDVLANLIYSYLRNKK